MQLRSTEVLTQYCRERMAVGSLSFSLASRLLGQREQADILMLYTWCRHCDDAIDALPLESTVEAKLHVIESLRRETLAALAGNPGANPVFQSLSVLARNRQIPAEYFEELLLGMEMDAVGTVYETYEQLELYCYRVAGVVGLMYCHVVGVSDPAALRHAVDLGIAMQLTNIARDVFADRALGRSYLPKQWVTAEGDVGAFRRILDTADRCYASGEAGIKFLPFAAACAAAAARYVYGAIGTTLRRRGAKPQMRVIVPGWHKLGLALRGVLFVATQIPYRLARPWTAATLQVWRLPQCHP